MHTAPTQVVAFGSAIQPWRQGRDPRDLDVMYTGDADEARAVAELWAWKKGLVGLPVDLHQSTGSDPAAVVIPTPCGAHRDVEVIHGAPRIEWDVRVDAPAVIRAYGDDLQSLRARSGLVQLVESHDAYGGIPGNLAALRGAVNRMRNSPITRHPVWPLLQQLAHDTPTTNAVDGIIVDFGRTRRPIRATALDRAGRWAMPRWTIGQALDVLYPAPGPLLTA